MSVDWEAIQKEKEEKLKEFPNAVVVGKSKLIYQLDGGHFVFW